MRPLRVGIIGLGVGEQHIAGYQNHAHCEVVALCDFSDEKLAAAREKYPRARLTGSADDVLLDPQIDVVSIASYDDAHSHQVAKALDAGKHVFVEKPLCQTMDELRSIKRAWAAHEGRLKLTSNLVLRAAPVYEWLKERITNRDFGRLYAFDGDYLYGRLHKITDGWRKDVDGYSVMLGGGIHLIDLMVWLTGERPRAVCAAGNRTCTENTDFRYHDYVTATLQCPSGFVGRVTANFGCVHRHQHVVRLFGTESTFIHDDAGPRQHVTRDPTVAASPVALPTLPETKHELIAPFVGAILGDENSDAHTQEMFDVISICLACNEALRSNSMVEVEYV